MLSTQPEKTSSYKCLQVNNPSKVCGLHRPCSIIYQLYKTFIYTLKPWFDSVCPNVIIFAWPFDWDLLKHDRNWFSPCMHICIWIEHLCMNAKEGIQHRRFLWVIAVIHRTLRLHPISTRLAISSNMTNLLGLNELQMRWQMDKNAIILCNIVHDAIKLYSKEQMQFQQRLMICTDVKCIFYLDPWWIINHGSRSCGISCSVVPK